MHLKSALSLMALTLGAALLWRHAPVTRDDPGTVPSSRRGPEASGALVAAPGSSSPTSATTRSPNGAEVRPAAPSRSEVVAWRQLDEDEIISELRELGAADAELALQLVGEATVRFPDSPRAAERAYFQVRALVNSGQLEEAITRARALVAAHPHHPLANEVARHLLSHPLTHPTEVGRR